MSYNIQNIDLTMLCMYYRDVLTDTNYEPFLNIQCGADAAGVQLDMHGDNTGDNISYDNCYWSEITGIYWAWKNLELTGYVGLCSYRRFFNFKNSTRPIELINTDNAPGLIKDSFDTQRISEILSEHDVILPIAYNYPWSIRRVCSKNYKDEDFLILENYIAQNHPSYLEDYKHIMYKSNSMVGHNMFVMRAELFSEYCEWVFDILLGIRTKVNPENYPIHQVRVFGYMHELLLPTFIRKKQLKVFSSQLMWVNDNVSKFRFNNPLYRYTSELIYQFSKLLGSKYPHIVK
ncbi:DUF4422 domain-containing protein [Vibrio vulnificus]|uniref:DUF4422 domain-containing protein n=1 Tax=Vibrio vulnificus TaxID=672 RepID=UPI001EEBD292|nr:DUF4422 domain-containing protein [Vibrio vulnificus]EHZ7120556.1 DUF4422 domain-containing protein [Vibrio vulnificus]EJE8737468.1 DUF4422 domain-containing protein [Vibrio vulnificus]EJL7832580.1 DUF4422 domain-containing protein [Vibrio vulnificus]EKO5190437.1 DUF4422 domain-containing protein [Vibrio vulnificus]MCG6275299.1 DUF4422 domain-containing protein [Vibrio vulnificus]